MSDERDGVPVSVAWILIAALAAALFLTGRMRETTTQSDGGFPANANGLHVVTVQNAIEVQQLGAGSDVAVSGWFQQAAPVPCEAPDPASVELLNGNCNLEQTWLMAEPESLVRVGPNGADGGNLNVARHPSSVRRPGHRVGPAAA